MWRLGNSSNSGVHYRALQTEGVAATVFILEEEVRAIRKWVDEGGSLIWSEDATYKMNCSGWLPEHYSLPRAPSHRWALEGRRSFHWAMPGPRRRARAFCGGHQGSDPGHLRGARAGPPKARAGCLLRQLARTKSRPSRAAPGCPLPQGSSASGCSLPAQERAFVARIECLGAEVGPSTRRWFSTLPRRPSWTACG